MKKINKIFLVLLSCVLCFISINASGQSSKFNLDFENTVAGMPREWKSFGSVYYLPCLDSTIVYNGKYSASIEFEEGGAVGFRTWALNIPGSYDGEKITFSGYIKTENITDGYAGLLMRIDPEIGFANMSERGVRGTTDWTEYEITLPLKPEATTNIMIGGIIMGKGKMWLDGLKVSIDGNDIELMTALPIKIEQTESGIKKIDSSDANIRALKELGLIWGFLKYYHPAVAQGKYDWDRELFDIMPKILAQKNRAARDAVFVDWINSLGEVSKNDNPEDILHTDDVKLKPDLEWIENSGFSPLLSKALSKVWNAKRTGTNHYVKMKSPVLNPEFTNEKIYAAIKSPDAGFRMLALFRYWNVIQYYFPYRYLIGEDWKNMLDEYIPVFINAQDETQYAFAVLELVGRVCDTHANIYGLNAIEHYKGNMAASPVLAFIENHAVVTGFYDLPSGKDTGLRLGDIILEIDNKKVEDIVRERLCITPASNTSAQLRDIARDLLRTNASSVVVKFKSADSISTTELDTYQFTALREKNKQPFTFLPDNIAILYPGSLQEGELNSLWKKIQNTKALIVDLRCYPSVEIISFMGFKLFPKPIPFVKFTSGSVMTPGLYKMSREYTVGTYNQDSYQGKVIVLVNEQTQSSAEYTAMVLQAAPDCLVIGSTTAGADGNVSSIVLPGDIRTLISGIGVYYPGGEETQRVGIVPDVYVTPTIKGISEGRDEPLEKAIDIINDTFGLKQ